MNNHFKRASISKDLRAKLEYAVKAARRIAEAAATDELNRLGVGAKAAPAYLSPEERELRVRLRSHGRALGDLKARDESQEIHRLATEVAYEHWHRMLFARFLADNELLIHPEYKVHVSLAECAELAAEAEKASKRKVTTWEVAAGFASRMLPQIFRPDSPCFAFALAPDARTALETLLSELPREIFLADDSLGWVYQFWQAEAKDAVNRSEKKIGAEELPAVTQLFTEDYMVSFLLDNSLGAWWAGKRLSPTDFSQAEDEASLRRKLALPGLPFDYLRFVKDEKGWRPAAGSYEAWPKSVKELKYLDPCCGSGHFLVAGFRYLIAMRMAEEGLDSVTAGDAVLRDNLFGLELDPRCVEIAAFSLAFEAWRSGGGSRELPELHVACSGAAPRTSREEWLRVADRAAGLITGGVPELIPDPKKVALWKSQLHEGMAALYELFKDAPVLGSLIDPRSVTSTLFREGYDQTAGLLAEALKKEKGYDESRETGVVAQGIAKAASLLAGRYHLVATNVPYLARGKQDEKLRDFCEKHYEAAKNDLATVFLDRCLGFCAKGGTTSIVLPQNWLFLTSYRKFREKLLLADEWNALARLGPGAFETISGEVVNVALVTISAGAERGRKRITPADGEGHRFMGIDAAGSREPGEKATLLTCADVEETEQASQLVNPDGRISFSVHMRDNLLSNHADSFLGLGTGGFEQFGRFFWEFARDSTNWSRLQTAAQNEAFYNGFSYYVAWSREEKRVRGMDELYRERIHNQDQSGQQAWGHYGIAIALMRGLRSSLFLGDRYDKSMAVIVSKNDVNLSTLYAFCSSADFSNGVCELDKGIIIANGTLVKVPFDKCYWEKAGQEKYPHGLPRPFSNDPTQWLFHGHPSGSVLWSDQTKRLYISPLRKDMTVLQVAIARLLGYRWPAELDPEMELSAESRTIVAYCDALLPFADENGIVCIPSVAKERPAADRLIELLAAAYGKEWSASILDELLAASDWAGRGLESWLRDGFFEQHCKLFGHRPFIWQVWDGQKDGFSVLVNYHGLTKAKLEKLIYVHLGDWIRVQEEGERAKLPGASVRFAAARELKTKLERILEGEAPYDIFVRWKSLKEQPLGWDPDLNDGVRLNIRPFMTAGVLRHNKPPKLNVKWDKDRGKDVESAPWFRVFNGERINDYHTSLEEKRKARGTK